MAPFLIDRRRVPNAIYPSAAGALFSSHQFVQKGGSSDATFAEQTQTSTITSVDLTRAIVIPSNLMGAVVSAALAHGSLWSPVLTGATTVSWYSQSEDSLAGYNMSAWVLEFTRGIKSIQVVSKAIALNAGSGTTTSTISSVDTSKAITLLVSMAQLLVIAPYAPSLVDPAVTGATTLTWTYQLNTGLASSANFRALVIEPS